MALKSSSGRYGRVAVVLHWAIAIAVLVALKTGFSAARAVDGAEALSSLRIHIPAAGLAAALTLLRLVWWLAVDNRPAPPEGQGQFQRRLAGLVHALLYIVPLGMAASGVGMLALTGAAEIIFGSAPGPLPDFRLVLPRVPHGIGARLLVALVLGHVAAALWHQFVKRDNLLSRMRLTG
jgi:cytochrome b561